VEVASSGGDGGSGRRKKLDKSIRRRKKTTAVEVARSPYRAMVRVIVGLFIIPSPWPHALLCFIGRVRSSGVELRADCGSLISDAIILSQDFSYCTIKCCSRKEGIYDTYIIYYYFLHY
jgi:hypothetical protein